MRYELNQNGEIVEYNGGTQFIADVNNTIIELFSQGIYNCNITNQDGSVYTLDITNTITNTVNTILLFYGNVRNENRNPSEKKIQLNGKDPRNSNTPAIILGIYCYDTNDVLADLICCAWNVDDTVNYPGNPSIRGINIQMFQEARFNGFVKKDYRNNTVCVFRPEFIFYYLESKNEHHASTENQNVANTDIETSLESGIQKIFYGAPGTGKSHKVKSLVNGKDARMQRVTFHPEFDYTSFVGGYKPTMADEDGKEVIKYKFVPQAFTNIYVKAWNDPDNDYYLVIEEINRGNCAEIFGDIFQLLDRDSDYDITPSIELEGHLKTSLKDVNKGLENGKLKLPKNLTIYATMNTSDQSLFPMDSAFKRRWDWEYIPICYEAVTDEGDSNPSFNYTINLGNGKSFKWNEFISKVNLNHIQQNPVLGMDKCIGNYFVKPRNGVTTIEVETFINKAVFYLWNDVFKDEKNEVFEENSSYEDFFPIKTKGVQKLLELLERIEVTVNTIPEDSAPAQDEVTN
tara:strand:+ start:4730 stop:6277 length:1548 start_codon:yes stop_codon:yes gene_type:complete